MFLLLNILRKHYIIISIFLVMPNILQAGEQLTLQQSIYQVVNHNRALLAGSERVDQARELVNDMQGKRLPRVDVSTAWTYSNSPLKVFGDKLQQQSITTADFSPNTLNNPSYQKNYQSRLGLSLPLFAGGALQAAEQQAEGNAEAATLDFEFQKQQRIYQTVVTYMQALQYGEQLEKNKQSVKAAEKRWLDTKALQNKGMALMSDVMQAHVYVLRRELAVDETANAYQVSLEQLALLMGSKKPFSQAVLSQPMIHLGDEPLDDLLQRAGERRLDFQAMQQRWQAVSLQRKIAYAGNLPHVDLVAAQEWNSATPALKHGNAMVGITVSMNIFNGGSDHAKQRQAESAYAALQWEIKDQQQLIANQVRQAWRALHIAKRKLNRETEVFQQSKESLRILSLRYKQGLETTSEVLDAQVAMDDSQVAIVRARSEMMIAQAALLLAAGLLGEGVV